MGPYTFQTDLYTTGRYPKLESDLNQLRFDSRGTEKGALLFETGEGWQGAREREDGEASHDNRRQGDDEEGERKGGDVFGSVEGGQTLWKGNFDVWKHVSVDV